MTARRPPLLGVRDLPAPLRGHRTVSVGEWSVVAPPAQVDRARAILAPLTVEAVLQACAAAPGVAAGGPGGIDPAVAGAPAPRAGAGGGGQPDLPAPPVAPPETEPVSSRGNPRVAPSGRGAVLEVDCGDGVAVIIKALKRGGLPARIRGGTYGASRLLAELAILEEAHARGVPTPPPAFGAAGRDARDREVAILATIAIPGVVTLGAILERASTTAPREEREPAGTGDDRDRPPTQTRGRGAAGGRKLRRAWMAAAGAAVGRAHDLGLDHADLNIGNILLHQPGGTWRGSIVDLGISTLGPPLITGRRAANLVRLLRSAEKHLGSDPRRAGDAAAFLRGYLAGSPDPGRRHRRDLLAAIRRRLPALALHRLGWRVLGRR